MGLANDILQHVGGPFALGLYVFTAVRRFVLTHNISLDILINPMMTDSDRIACESPLQHLSFPPSSKVPGPSSMASITYSRFCASRTWRPIPVYSGRSP